MDKRLKEERAAAYAALRDLFEPYAHRLSTTADDGTNYMLDGAHSRDLKRPMFFGGVRLGKNYVSYYLMPVYMYPELLSPISDALRKRMQGKSCFNFVRPDPELLAELAKLTKTAFARFAREGHLK